MKTDTNEVLTDRQAAKFLKCSESHFWKIINKGEINYIDLAVDGQKNRQIRILKVELINWFKTQHNRGKDALKESTE